MEMIKLMREENYSESSVNVVKSDYSKNGINFDKNEIGTNPKQIQWHLEYMGGYRTRNRKEHNHPEKKVKTTNVARIYH